MKATSEAQIEAVRRYEEKTYAKLMFHLRKDEDAEIIAAIEEAKQHGTTKREWLSAIFYAKPEIPEDLVPLEKVEEALRAFRVEGVDVILEDLRK